MAWETRGTRKYFYQSVWEDGRVVKKYVGGGEKAKAAAKKVAESQSERASEIAEVEHWTEKLRELEQTFSEFQKYVKSLVEAHMLAGGYYQASRTWRKRKRK